VHAIIIFDEIQNGAIWGHFRVSYNIESSTILMTDRQEYLKIVKNVLFVSWQIEHFHCFVQVHFKISVNMHQSQSFFIAELTQVFKRLSTLNDCSLNDNSICLINCLTMPCECEQNSVSW
jgi:hypothetical protein